LPDSNPGGSGNYGYDEDPSKTITNPEFWDSLLGESDAEDESALTEASNSTPTGELTKKAIPENDATTKTIHPTKLTDWEGEDKRVKSREVKKTVFAHGYEAGIVPAEQLVPCPVQEDPNKFSRKNCALITDESVDRMTDLIIDLATSTKPNRVKMELPRMPYYKREAAIGYMDIETGECVFFHKNGDYWSYTKYDKKDDIVSLLAESDSVKYAKDYKREL